MRDIAKSAELAGSAELLPSHLLFFLLCPAPGVEKEVLPGIRLPIVPALSRIQGPLRRPRVSPALHILSPHPLVYKMLGLCCLCQGPSSGDMTCFVFLHPLTLLKDAWGTLERCHAHPGVPCAFREGPGLLPSGGAGWRAGAVRGSAFRCFWLCFIFKGGMFSFYLIQSQLYSRE